MGRYGVEPSAASRSQRVRLQTAFAPGRSGLRAEMGAMATITLPAASGADTASLRNAATLQLRNRQRAIHSRRC